MTTGRLTSRLSDLGDPAVVLENSRLPDIRRNLREGLGWRPEEHPEVDVVLDVVGLRHLQSGEAGQVLTDGLVESDHSVVVIRHG